MAVSQKAAPKSSAGSKKSTKTNPPKAAPAVETKATAADVAASKPDGGNPAVRRKEMVERIVAATGKKPNEIKSVLDGVLVELGKALSAGESLNLHPLGKVSVNRQKKFDNREVLVCKIRRKLEPVPSDEPFKTAAE